MSWSDDYYSATNAVTSSNLSTASAPAWIYYFKKFLARWEKKLRMVPLGTPYPLPMNSGDTAKIHRYLNIAASVSDAHLSNEGVHPSAIQFKQQQLSMTPQLYGAFGQITDWIDKTKIDPGKTQISGIFSHHGARIMDMLAHNQVASCGGFPMRADFATDTGARFAGTVDSATATTLVDATLSANTDFGDANDDLNQSIVIVKDGTGYGQARAVTDYAQATGTMTVLPAWDVTPVAGDGFTVVTFDGIASGDTLSYESIVRAVRILLHNEAQPGDDGYFRCPIDPFVGEGILNDDKFIKASEYRTDKQGLFNSAYGRFAGVEFLPETNPFTFPITTRGTAGAAYGVGADDPANSSYTNYSTTGTVTLVPILGKDVFAVSQIGARRGAEGQPDLIIKGKEFGGPLELFSTLGWKGDMAVKATNPMWCVSIAVYNGIQDAA